MTGFWLYRLHALLTKEVFYDGTQLKGLAYQSQIGKYEIQKLQYDIQYLTTARWMQFIPILGFPRGKIVFRL